MIKMIEINPDKIAEIIKLHQDRLYKGVFISLSKMIADYFEVEDKQFELSTPNGWNFDKKQFLKDCGCE